MPAARATVDRVPWRGHVATGAIRYRSRPLRRTKAEFRDNGGEAFVSYPVLRQAMRRAKAAVPGRL
jgi:hypothetical protein